MEADGDEFDKLLNSNGRLGKLRRSLVTFLLSLEGVQETLSLVDGNEAGELRALIEQINSLLKDFFEAQRIADRAIINFSVSEREILYKESPEVFEIFGWENKTEKKEE